MKVKQGWGQRGSLLWLQRLIGARPDLLRSRLAGAGVALPDEELRWVSPEPDHDWSEYRDADFLDIIGLSKLSSKLSDFWPLAGPQWDALAVSQSNPNKVVLLEAKAYPGEMTSNCQAKAASSKQTIQASLETARERLGCSKGGSWLKPYYQYANRLAHLNFLREHGVDAHLVFLYFTGETEMPGAPISEAQWDKAIEAAHKALGIPESGLTAVHSVFVDVKPLRLDQLQALARVAKARTAEGYAKQVKVTRFAVIEGGAILIADQENEFAVIADARTLAELADEDLQPVSIYTFDTKQARDVFAHALALSCRATLLPD